MALLTETRRLQLREADIGLNRYWSESNKSWADIRYNINKATGHVLERDSAITTDCPSFSWSALLFSIKTEINRSPNIMSFGRISDNSKSLRKPEKAKKDITRLRGCKRSLVSVFPLIFWDALPREVPFDVLQERRLDEPRPLWPLLLWVTYWRGDSCQIAQPLERLEGKIYWRNWIRRIQ